MQITHNKLLPIVAIVMLVVAGGLYLSSDDEGKVPAGEAMTEVPVAELPATEPGADADTPQETLNTVVGGFRRVEQELAALKRENERLQRENRQARDMEARLNAQVDRGIDRGLSQLRAQNEALAAQNQSQSTGAAAEGMPDGYGFEGETAQGVSTTTATAAAPPAPAARLVLPVGYRVGKGADGATGVFRDAPGSGAVSSAAAGTAATAEPPKPVPYYTIPENATLIGATAMSAVVGRVPVDGQVQDPMQFKLLIGPENLAANGHYLPPNLAGIVVSGIAIGDMTLSCSEGFIQSMTFVFADGTIQTVSERNNGGSIGAGGTASIASSNKLGYLSDERGNPCIAGRFVTNAPSYLTDIVGLKTLSVAGAAAAASETTQTTNVLGGSGSTVTGSRGRYILGQAVSGGVDEITNWILKRMDNSFDAVVTPAGASVVVNIDKEIPIDKKPDARRLDYGRVDSAMTNAQRGQWHGLD